MNSRMILAIVLFILYIVAYSSGIILYFNNYLTGSTLHQIFSIGSFIFVIGLFGVMTTAYTTACVQ